MIKKKFKNKIFAVIAAGAITVMSVLSTANVYAESYNITLKCATTDGKTVMPGEKFNLYKICDEDFNFTNSFAKAKETIGAQNLTMDNEQQWSNVIEEYLENNANITPDITVTTNSSGAIASVIDEGLYYIEGKDITINNYKYSPEPLMVFTRDLDDANVTCYVKYSSNEIKPTSAPNNAANGNNNTGTTAGSGGNSAVSHSTGTDSTGKVRTGDETDIAIMLGLLCAAMTTIAAILRIKNKNTGGKDA